MDPVTVLCRCGAPMLDNHTAVCPYPMGNDSATIAARDLWDKSMKERVRKLAVGYSGGFIERETLCGFDMQDWMDAHRYLLEATGEPNPRVAAFRLVQLWKARK